MMKSFFAFLLTLTLTLAVFGTAISAAADPDFLGLVTDDAEFHRLCDVKKETALKDKRQRACFTIKTEFSKYISNPIDRNAGGAKKLKGFVDKTGKQFVLFTGASVTIDEQERVSIEAFGSGGDAGIDPAAGSVVLGTSGSAGSDQALQACSYISVIQASTWWIRKSTPFCPGRDEPFAL